MKFFNKYPKINYKFGSNKSTNQFTDLSRYADVIDQVKDDATAYTYYRIMDGERPDIVSQKLYDSPVYGWTFFILNDHLKDQGWPLSYQDFRDFLSVTLPGQFITVNSTSVHSESGITVHALTEQFPKGSDVMGTTSGASGKVYMRNLNLGQLFINEDVGTFSGSETINDTLVGSPQYTAVTTGQGLAYKATHHYEDSNGEWVDIDPTTGIVPANYTEITHEEFLESENDKLSRIRVLKPSLILRFSALYKDTINR